MPVEKLTQKLVSWIKTSTIAAGGKGVVFGMSGGIDSSVVAVLCQKAFPSANLGIIMPCQSNVMDQKHAELVANEFHISTKVIVLDSVFEMLIKTFSASNDCNSPKQRLSKANIKPRLRMLTLYYFANNLDYLVVGSTNKCELFVGYFTKYGDGGVDIMPLGNLVKSEVKELAVYLKIPREVIEKPPSGGLWDGQTDEKEMGLTYNELDHYLITGEAEKIIKAKIESLADKNSHKLCLPPISPNFSHQIRRKN